jgi:peptidoglycan/xylan/chitin deacetylase (PgdA/CDA1 family)
MQRPNIKQSILWILKFLGFFDLFSLLTRRRLRILCFHGLSLVDEHEFNPKLFMRPSTFANRLQIIKKGKYNVITLERAISGLINNDLPALPIVITADDGWFGMYRFGAPLLAQHGFPWTQYLTSYYVLKETQVFNLATRYIVSKTQECRFDTSSLNMFNLTDERKFDLTIPSQRGAMEALLIHHGQTKLNSDQRQRFLLMLGQVLNVDISSCYKHRVFCLMNTNEVKALSTDGVDIQLHTHRHRPNIDNQEEFEKEITENRQVILDITGKDTFHFCYPSGIFHKRVQPWLRNMGIKSAVTTDTGLNAPQCDLFELKRFVDGEDVSEIEFEAELSGLMDVLRSLRKNLFRGGLLSAKARPSTNG